MSIERVDQKRHCENGALLKCVLATISRWPKLGEDISIPNHEVKCLFEVFHRTSQSMLEYDSCISFGYEGGGWRCLD